MAKARARAAPKKAKDKWKAKSWFQILAPPLFDLVPVAETLTDTPNKLIGRVAEVSLQEITNDFRKSHLKLYFKIHRVDESQAHTQVAGHTLTSDYLRRMIRRRRSRIDGVYDVTTRDGAILRVKPFAIAEKRIQSSQKKTIREIMKKTVIDSGATQTLNEFIRDALDGKVGSDIYKNCKNLYPVKRIEISKTEVIRQPTIEIKDRKPAPKPEEETPAPEAVPEAEPKPPEKEPGTPASQPDEGAEEKPEQTGEEKTTEETPPETEEKETKKLRKKLVKKTAKTKADAEGKKTASKTRKKNAE